MIVFPAGFKRCALKLLLIENAAERTLVRKILGRERDQKRRVGVFSVAGAVAHAVGHDAAFFRCRRDDVAARAHAEGVCACAVRELDVQLIVCRAERRIVRKRAVLRLVDGFLQMLDANAHRKRLRLHGNAEPVQHAEGVSGAVTGRKNEMAARKRLLAGLIFIAHAADRAVLQHDVRELCAEADLAAERKDFLAQILHDGYQYVRSDVRLCIK